MGEGRGEGRGERGKERVELTVDRGQEVGAERVCEGFWIEDGWGARG